MPKRLIISVFLGLLVFMCGELNGQVFKWGSAWNSTGTQKDIGYGVAVDGSGNVYTTGGAKQGATNDSYVEIIKYNSSGTQQWATSVNVTGTSGNCDEEKGYCISVDANGYVWVAAASYSGGTNYNDLTLIRLNSSGTVQTNYPKRYSVATDACGGGAPEVGTALYVYNGSNVYIGGSNYNNSTSTWSYILLKDDVGNSGWLWNYTKSGTLHGMDHEHRVTDIYADANYVYATGWIKNTSQAKDVWTVKLNAGTGTASWTAQYDNSGDTYDQVGNVIGVDNSGNVYVAGTKGISGTHHNALLLKYNSSGTFQFASTHAGSGGTIDSWNDMVVLSSGSSIAVYVGGYTDRGSSTFMDYMLAAYSSSGGLATGWSTNPVYYDGASTSESSKAPYDRGYALEYSVNTGKVYITGRARENTPNSNDVNITTRGYSGSTGSNVWSVSYDYGSPDIANTDEMAWKFGMKVRWNSSYCGDEIYIVGDRFTSSTGYDFITLKYGPNGIPCEGPEEGRLIAPESAPKLFPNPFSVRAELILPVTPVDATLLIYDVAGRLIVEKSGLNSEHVSFERGSLGEGVYLYWIVESGEVIANGRFIIMD